MTERSSRLGVRLTATLAATAVVATAFAVSGVLLVALIHRSLISNLDAAATTRAHDVASLASTGRLRGLVPSASEETAVVQVIGPSGTVLAATGNIEGERAMLTVPRSRRRVAVTSSTLPVGETAQPFRVVAEPVTLTEGPGWVLVASSLSQLDSAVSRLVILLAFGLPVLLLVIGAVIWLTVGRALRPVEQIRRRAAAIGTAELERRVPVPGSRDEVARLATTMNEMLSRLEAGALRQRQFVGDASHELRSPLSALLAQIHVALAYPEPERQAHVLGRVRQQAERMTELIDDLLFLARADEGDVRPSGERVDLDELVLAEASRLRSIGSARIEVVGPDAAAVTGSDRDLTRVLHNLGDNALAHASSTVTLGLRSEAGTAVLTVTDDGPGIAPSDRVRVFERFTRLDEGRSRKTGGGTGLGLSITQQIVRAYGGQITVEERPDGQAGAVFVVRIPLTDPAPSEVTARH
jgi:signal transduction histidine kinase